MGIFKFLKKEKQNIENTSEELGQMNQSALERNDEEISTKIDEVDKKSLNLDSKEDRKDFINDHCERIMVASRQIDETKVEYQAVTSYLTDMQKIDMIPKDERQNIDDAARRIITLTRDRAKYQNSNNKITDKQYRNIEKYEDEMPDELKKMKENEDYQRMIKNDMRHLEGEKGVLKFQKEEIIKKQQYLKGLAVVTCVLVILLFVLFVAIEKAFQTNIQLPFILTILMGTVSAVYIYIEARKNAYNMKVVGLKQNKAIDLLNSVKIKYINNTSVLDYSYNKYMVNNYQELSYLWEQYIKAKDAAKRYEKNTELLNFYNETLIKELKKYQVEDADIWIYQAIAIIDQKEMVEVRHRLNVRRQKLRERIDYNNQVKERSLREIKDLLKKKPNIKQEVVNILGTYQIDIEY